LPFFFFASQNRHTHCQYCHVNFLSIIKYLTTSLQFIKGMAGLIAQPTN
jgi:hypothetical protein